MHRTWQGLHIAAAAGAGTISAFWIWMPSFETIKSINPRLQERQARWDAVKEHFDAGALTALEAEAERKRLLTEEYPELKKYPPKGFRP
mmetsp:Transcript_40167/g.98703  ORF Transcript_40167/g.98703 Transcript_40167/m.98703 type:complete len:89 (+) Transcript_40167:312-578(+)